MRGAAASPVIANFLAPKFIVLYVFVASALFDHFRGRVRLGGIGCFLQIQTGAKRRACATKNQNALVWMLRRVINDRTQFS